jgi:hypothetical protein
MLPSCEEEILYSAGDNNDGFHRLDLSGSVGRSISFKQLVEVGRSREQTDLILGHFPVDGSHSDPQTEFFDYSSEKCNC